MPRLMDASAAAELFRAVPWLHGLIEAGLHGMGSCWCDDAEVPSSAVLLCGDFAVCAGSCGSQAEALLKTAVAASNSSELIICGDEGWLALADRVLDRQLTIGQRWAFDPDIQPHDDHLIKLLRAVPTLRFHMITGQLIAWCRKQAWARDFVSCYATDADFEQHGCGMLAEIDGELAVGASSYVSYAGGMEVQVQTCDGFEGRGYATAVAAALITYAHRLGLKANWDAANAVSAHIAQRLGYVCTGAYEVRILKR